MKLGTYWRYYAGLTSIMLVTMLSSALYVSAATTVSWPCDPNQTIDGKCSQDSGLMKCLQQNQSAITQNPGIAIETCYGTWDVGQAAEAAQVANTIQTSIQQGTAGNALPCTQDATTCQSLYKCTAANGNNPAGQLSCYESLDPADYAAATAKIQTVGTQSQPTLQQAATPAPSCTGANCGNISYTPLEPLLPNAPADISSNFGAYLNLMFKLLLSVGALLAVARLVVGGIMYMTSEVMETKGDAKRWMTSSIYGLLLLAGSWLILYTINPDLLKFNLVIPSSTITGTPTNQTDANGTGGGGGAQTTSPSVNGCLSQYGFSYYPGSASQTQALSQCTSQCSGSGGKLTATGNGTDNAGVYTEYKCVKAQ